MLRSTPWKTNKSTSTMAKFRNLKPISTLTGALHVKICTQKTWDFSLSSLHKWTSSAYWQKPRKRRKTKDERRSRIETFGGSNNWVLSLAILAFNCPRWYSVNKLISKSASVVPQITYVCAHFSIRLGQNRSAQRFHEYLFTSLNTVRNQIQLVGSYCAKWAEDHRRMKIWIPEPCQLSSRETNLTAYVAPEDWDSGS